MKLIRSFINWIKSLLGLDKKDDPNVKWLEKQIAAKKKKLKEIDNEEHDIDSIVDHFNK